MEVGEGAIRKPESEASAWGRDGLTPFLKGTEDQAKIEQAKLKAMCSRASTGGNAWLVATLLF
jgi:hypothetical protein